MSQVLIIGAGPYGVGVAQELWARGIEPTVVGEPFATWHEHTPDAMFLRSDPKASGIHAPDRRYEFPAYLRAHAPTDATGAVAIEVFRDYLEWVVERLPFRLVRDRVEWLGWEGEGASGGERSGFEARLAGGERIRAARVVLATGLGGHTYLPPSLAALPEELRLHSWEVARTQALAGQRVLVVGGGQSAAEAVDALRESNRVTWALRHPPFFFREPLRVPSPLFKTFLAAYGLLYLLPPAVLRRISAAVFRTTVSPYLARAWNDPEVAKLESDAEALGLRADGPEVVSESGERWDRVVAATGYRATVGGLSYLSPELTEALGGPAAIPTPDASFESQVPGLFLVGCLAESTWGPAMRFILGSKQAARGVGKAVAP
jgi:cation diffusion facilitator CzcD-associated flavoprotein CzcO